MTIKELLNEVMKCQKQVSDTQQLLADLKQAVTKEQGIIDLAQVVHRAIVDLAREGEDLLAEAAIGGTVDAAQLGLIEKQLAEAAVNADDMQSDAARATRTRAGLLRKIEAAELALKRAIESNRAAFVEYLTALAEGEGKEYKRLATLLMAKSERICAISRILQKQPGIEGLSLISSGHNERFLIPGFNLESCRGAVHGDIWRLMITEPESIMNAVASMTSEIKGLGVDIPA